MNYDDDYSSDHISDEVMPDSKNISSVLSQNLRALNDDDDILDETEPVKNKPATAR